MSPVSVDAGLDPILDPEAGTFSLLNLRQVVLELVPAPCSASTRLLVLVSSGPANTAPRQAWRQRCGIYIIYSIYNIYVLYLQSAGGQLASWALLGWCSWWRGRSALMGRMTSGWWRPRLPGRGTSCSPG